MTVNETAKICTFIVKNESQEKPFINTDYQQYNSYLNGITKISNRIKSTGCGTTAIKKNGSITNKVGNQN